MASPTYTFSGACRRAAPVGAPGSTALAREGAALGSARVEDDDLTRLGIGELEEPDVGQPELERVGDAHGHEVVPPRRDAQRALVLRRGREEVRDEEGHGAPARD